MRLFVEQLLPSLDSRAAVLAKWLLDTPDFWSFPGSTRFHHNYDGGLAEHCEEVFQHLKTLCEAYSMLRSRSRRSRSDIFGMSLGDLFIIAYGHDLQKLNAYKVGSANKKIDGQWRSVKVWEHKTDYLGMGHSAGSLEMLDEIFVEPLPRIIRRAILFHMGPYEHKDSYAQACAVDPLVLLTHTADMMSTAMNAPKMEKIREQRGY